MAAARSLGALDDEVRGVDLISPEDLSPAQAERLVRAVAIFEAQRQALKAGMSLDEVKAQRWSVDVQPL